jgi:tetratricopeptide (TPR) repeat protein
LRLPRSLAFGIGLSALAAAAGLGAPALAASATLRGEVMPPGFGRIALTFDEPTQTRIRVSNGVLVVAFGSSVKVDVARIARELPAYVSIARVDPDGRGMRLALAQPYRANLIEAGERAFIDLLPENWKGVLPGPPPEVIADMTERLRQAESRAREAARAAQAARKPLVLRSASLPTLDRLNFDVPPETKLTSDLKDGLLTLTFDQPLSVDPAVIRNALPEGVALRGQETGKASTTVALAVPKSWQMRSFRDEDGLTVDLLRPPGAAATPDPVAALIAAAAPAAESAAPPAAAPSGQAPAAPAPATPTASAPAAAAPAADKPAAPPAPAPAQAAAAPPVDPFPQPIRIVAGANRLDFRFPRPTGAAAFVESGIATLVFDTRDTIDPSELKGVLPQQIEEATVTREGRVVRVRLRLAGQPLTRLFDDGNTWSLGFGDQAVKVAEPLAPARGVDDQGQTMVAVPLRGLTGVHWLEPGPSGLPIAVATATGPVQVTAKPYRFVEFGLLPTAHGIAVMPRSDDIVVRAATEQVRIGRSGGLTVTLDVGQPEKGGEGEVPADRTPLIDPGPWSKLVVDAVRDQERVLQREVSGASRARKSETRLALARFYAANGLMAEAKGPLMALMADDPTMRNNRQALFLKGLIAAQMHRHQEAATAFDAPAIKDDPETGLWRALVDQRRGRHGPALLGFRRADTILDRYPADLQAPLRLAKVRAALGLNDVTIAEREIQTLSAMPADIVDPEQLALLRAMVEEAAGRADNALAAYRPLFDAHSRPVAAEAQLRAVRLVQAEKRNDINPDEALARLETVSIVWRGGELEIEALGELARIYADGQRWRDAFMAARRASESFPDHPITRRMQDETAQRFADLFSGKGIDDLPRIDALALFYDFRDFLPIGRRGDEITRMLADRLVALDLLDQASDILRHQIERRLTGAARSTVAARLAMVDLMNNKPAEALRALNGTRLVELPADVKRARLLLEAKALSDLSRTDQALDLLEVERGPEIDRLRADIYWTGRRWREAGEAHERILDEAWRGEAPLTDSQRGDVMRAAISYVMADEGLSLDRLRSKFATKMAQSTDARTFAFVTGANRSKAADIREMARAAVAAGADNLSDFMQAYRERYPAYSTAARQKKPAAPPAAEAPPPATPPATPAAAAGANAPAPAPPGRS